MKLGALGEDRLLSRILLNLPRERGGKAFANLADDCAIVEIPASKEYLVLKTDCVVEGVHFVHVTRRRLPKRFSFGTFKGNDLLRHKRRSLLHFRRSGLLLLGFTAFLFGQAK